MSPCRAKNDSPNGLMGNLEHATEFAVVHALTIEFSDNPDVVTCELDTGSVLTSCSIGWHNATTLVVPVSVVISFCSEKEMVPINAGRIITSVENTLISGINTFTKVECDSVSQPWNRDSFIDDSITVVTCGSEPFPAIIRRSNNYMLPKTIKNGWIKLRDWFSLITGHVSSSCELMCLGRVHA